MAEWNTTTIELEHKKHKIKERKKQGNEKLTKLINIHTTNRLRVDKKNILLNRKDTKEENSSQNKRAEEDEFSKWTVSKWNERNSIIQTHTIIHTFTNVPTKCTIDICENREEKKTFEETISVICVTFGRVKKYNKKNVYR